MVAVLNVVITYSVHFRVCTIYPHEPRHLLSYRGAIVIIRLSVTVCRDTKPYGIHQGILSIHQDAVLPCVTYPIAYWNARFAAQRHLQEARPFHCSEDQINLQKYVLPVHNMKECRGSRGVAPFIFISTLDVNEWSVSRPDRIVPG
jgi:hypothetical protein